MMGRSLLIVGWLATIGFVGTGIFGYWAAGSRELMGIHLIVGTVSIVLLLFSHCWIMFYLIGTGKAIKTTVQEFGLTADHIERTKDFKNRSYPWLMLAMGLAMATFILGGGVATGALPRWVHHGLFYATAAAQVWTLLLEGSVLVANDRLMADINGQVEEQVAGQGAELAAP